jgi:hypothetical protein
MIAGLPLATLTLVEKSRIDRTYLAGATLGDRGWVDGDGYRVRMVPGWYDTTGTDAGMEAGEAHGRIKLRMQKSGLGQRATERARTPSAAGDRARPARLRGRLRHQHSAPIADTGSLEGDPTVLVQQVLDEFSAPAAVAAPPGLSADVAAAPDLRAGPVPPSSNPRDSARPSSSTGPTLARQTGPGVDAGLVLDGLVGTVFFRRGILGESAGPRLSPGNRPDRRQGNRTSGRICSSTNRPYAPAGYVDRHGLRGPAGWPTAQMITSVRLPSATSCAA